MGRIGIQTRRTMLAGVDGILFLLGFFSFWRGRDLHSSACTQPHVWGDLLSGIPRPLSQGDAEQMDTHGAQGLPGPTAIQLFPHRAWAELYQRFLEGETSAGARVSALLWSVSRERHTAGGSVLTERRIVRESVLWKCTVTGSVLRECRIVGSSVLKDCRTVRGSVLRECRTVRGLVLWK